MQYDVKVLEAGKVDDRQILPGPIDAPLPLVSCLMVTRGKRFPARHAIECYRRQTYPQRELVVVTDDPASEIAAYLDVLGDSSIRLIVLPAEGRSLGELRNISVEQAAGTYVCQWDDDDLYDPERIEVQLSTLVQTGATACILQRWTLWWPSRARLGISGRRLWEGSILARKDSLPPYPLSRQGEDTAVVEALTRVNPVAALEAPGLYVYIHHGSNTFAAGHFKRIFGCSVQRWIGEAYRARIDRLSTLMPIQAYADELGIVAPEGIKPDERSCPLVSIVVRSMARPDLIQALESLAAQDYPRLEVIVVDATGGKHPSLPPVVWRAGHAASLEMGQRPLNRPQAANVGLRKVRGAWFGFLDDDDTYDPDHVSTLVAAGSNTDHLVVYGQSRLIGPDGEVKDLVGLPFDRSLMAHGPLHTFPAALIRSEVIALGCAFDEQMEISEDRDFFAQIAQHSDFSFVEQPTFNYFVEAGTSGTGQGGNRNSLRHIRFDRQLHVKWFGDNRYHAYRAERLCTRAVESFQSNGADAASPRFHRVLDDYPANPNALYGLGYIDLQAGELEAAELRLRRAAEINPAAGEYRLTLAFVLERLGNHLAARSEAYAATLDSRVRDAANRTLQRLGGPPQQTPLVQRTEVQRKASAPERTWGAFLGLCSCGSGKRQNQCCGAPKTVSADLNSTERVAAQALLRGRQGESDAAMGLLSGIDAGELSTASVALACGRLCQEAGEYELACRFFERAASLERADHKAIEAAMALNCWCWFRDVVNESAARSARRLHGAYLAGERKSDDASASTKHVVCDFDRIGGAQQQALGLFENLSREASVRLWSTTEPHAAYASGYPIEHIAVGGESHPDAGHIIFVGQQFDYGDWLERSHPCRITICVVSSTLQDLIDRFVQIEDFPRGFALDFTFPSRYFQDIAGLPGVVEHPHVDGNRFHVARSASADGRFVVGRHSRDSASKFHPNDPSFFRRLAAEGYGVRLLGGTILSSFLADEVSAGKLALMPESVAGVVDFLNGLDCFVYRIHPTSIETFGMVIAEAMAMELPVILFRGRIGCADLIENGVNGFLVDTEDEALACIKLLAADADRRRDIGVAARATVLEAMQAQSLRVLAFYLGG